jgi:P-type Cu2+ transporter
VSPSVPCVHCGAPAPAPPDEPAQAFCCAGCRTVFAVMSDAGLGRFYDLRDQMGEAGSGQPASEGGAEDYAHYDEPDFLARFAPDGKTVDLHVDGVHCAACVWVMDELPRVIAGVTRARLDFGRARLRLEWDPAATSLARVAGRLHQLGYPTHPLGTAAEAARKKEGRAELVRLGAMGAVAGNAMMIGAALYAGDVSGGMTQKFSDFFEWLSLGLAIPAVTYGALPFYRGALSGLRMRVAHIDLPIALGVLAAFGASVFATLSGHGQIYYDTVTALVFLLLVGRFVQTRGQRAALSRAEMAWTLLPGTAWRKRAEDWEACSVAALRVGDLVRVRAGETMPVDGQVERGAGHVDLRLLTGEARPVAVGPGDEVHAGTASAGAVLEIRATATGVETRLARLLDEIDRAGSERAPVVRLADRLSGWFVLSVLSLAAAGGVGWAFVDPTRVFDVVVSLLVVSCPCALGMATPVALAVARGRAAAAGVLLRDASAIERLAAVRHVWFDKTGTLTEGRLTVTRTELSAEARGLVGRLEAASSHPIGRALAGWADGAPARDTRETAGRGIEGTVDGHTVRAGRPDPQGPYAEQAQAAALAGDTPVQVWVDDEPAGWLALGDQIRPDAAEALAALHAMGLGVGILSGDHPGTVQAVAERLGVEQARGGQTPEDKATVVGASAGSAMVGDGFNDAPALRAAHVGVAVAGGAGVVVEVADVYLSRPGAKAVSGAVEGARRTLAVIRRNLAFSLLYNLAFASLALAGHISPLAAAVLMPISSLTVVAHSVLATSFRAP